MAKRSWATRSKAERRASRKAEGIRLNERRRLQNKPIRSALKTYINKAESMIFRNEEAVQAAVVTALSQLDKAATKGVIHRNQAARRKSRLMKKLNALAAPAAQA